jgi:DNA polymerase
MKNDPKQELKQYLHFLGNQPKGTVYNDRNPTAIKYQKQQCLDTLYEPYKSCNKCPLATLGRSTIVFGIGNPDADLMFVGEGPGRDEDRLGLPFVGRAGQLLTKIIQAMDMQRKDVFITNVVKCRPPNNRAPSPEESKICISLLLYKQIEIVQPKIICTLGSIATQAFLGPQSRISHIRGHFQEMPNYLLMPTYHPAYLLRNPPAKKLVWEDMKKIMKKLAELKSK